MDRLKGLKSEVNFLLEIEERMWRQRSRTSWLKDGDQNTRFFYRRASHRRRRNRIVGLRDNATAWEEDKDEVVSILLRYYETIFKSSQPTQIDEVVAHVPQVVSQSMNDSLLHEFTGGKVE
jgi:hypothetical protein